MQENVGDARAPEREVGTKISKPVQEPAFDVNAIKQP